MSGGSFLDLLEQGWRRDLADGAAPASLDMEEELLRAAARALGEQARRLTAGEAAARWPACVVVTLARAVGTGDGGSWPAWHRMAGGRSTRQSADQWGQAFLSALGALRMTSPAPAARESPRDAVRAYLAGAAAQERESSGAKAEAPEEPQAMRLDPFGAGVLLIAEERAALPDEAAGSADPLLVFDSEGELAGPLLPADLAWVLYPADRELLSDVQPRVIVAGRPPLTWRGWRLDQVDLCEASWIGLDGAERRTVRGRTSPVLRTGLPVPGVTAGRRPVYPVPPEVLLPPRGGQWRIAARRAGTGAVLASVTAAGESWQPDALWRKVPRPLLGELTITAAALDRGAEASTPGLRRTVVVAEGLAVTTHPAPRLPCERGLEPADSVIVTQHGMTVSPSALPFPPDEAEREVTCVAGPVVQRLTVTPPHVRLRVDPEPGSGQAPGPWHHAGPLRLTPGDLWRGGALRLDLPGVSVPPPVVITVRGTGEQLQVLAPTGQGRYPLRRVLDTMTAVGGLDLAVTVDGRTAVIAVVTAAARAADPWAIG